MNPLYNRKTNQLVYTLLLLISVHFSYNVTPLLDFSAWSCYEPLEALIKALRDFCERTWT